MPTPLVYPLPEDSFSYIGFLNTSQDVNIQQVASQIFMMSQECFPICLPSAYNEFLDLVILFELITSASQLHPASRF